MADLCARAEQCPYDIRRKLQLKGMAPADVESVISDLSDRGFLDSARYAGCFARDKVKFSAWGRLKIRAALAAKCIPSVEIAEALNSIDLDEYRNALSRAANSKIASLDLSMRNDRAKLFRHLLSRGFEPDLVSRIVNDLAR
ncbi:MAG: regulatory protein RecX [Lepagella sp.]